jgi:DNA-binding IclR family transcriptional regulator
VREAPLTAITERTPSTRAALFRELEQTLAQGYALSDEDVTPGIASLGAPIFDYTGRIRAALSIGGLKSFVLGDDRDAFVALLTQSAHEISAALGHK